MSTGSGPEEPQHEPGPEPEPLSLTRRELIKLGATSVLGIGIAVVAIDAKNAANARHEQERQAAVDFGRKVEKGLSGDWDKATVWPGLALIPHSVELFTTPTLHEGTKVDFPKDHLSDHLVVQRPFMVFETVQANPTASSNKQAVGPEDIDAEVLGFWLPNSNQLAYCDRAQYATEILLPTHSRAGIYENDEGGYQRIVGESVTLQPAAEREGLVWRYLDNTVRGILAKPFVSAKVCARSLWQNMVDSAIDYYSDEANQGSGADLISLPLPESQRG